MNIVCMTVANWDLWKYRTRVVDFIVIIGRVLQKDGTLMLGRMNNHQLFNKSIVTLLSLRHD